MAHDSEDLKRLAAIAALDEVKPGMKLGIGTGSTANAFIHALAERVAAGLEIIGVPTSERTAALAGSLGIRLSTLEETPELDVAIDGADEIGPGLALIKGGGGALLREKIVASAAKRFVVIADASKVVETLGRFPLPIEVVPFGLGATTRAIETAARALSLDGPLALRKGADGGPYVTDGGHFILDASFGRISDPERLSEVLHTIPGVVEHGLFVRMAAIAYVARPEGTEIIRA
ncbi:ribose-5-phosphate isomerase RpiA [Segnochrobactrum spirostomi]|uniref:Ribose-5-phosphate isomerase A n=1 Tax=Segnochrobactrum spirostomi TaxID=2608987 RepID=A0A6A7XXS9_9HYPH|nr:ribose-5-phosphate isomerase RpiA [Segnochrobactrum spirostomi]MQT11235.1 ribose-5-phosphate isomerase RpiA [Segnochrobactrum spirostomi]